MLYSIPMLAEIEYSKIENYRGKGLGNLGRDKVGILILNFWSPEEIRETVEKLEKLRPAWSFFKGTYNYSSFGNPLYAYRASNNLPDYFKTAEASDAKVQSEFPEFQKKMLEPFQIFEFPKEFR